MPDPVPATPKVLKVKRLIVDEAATPGEREAAARALGRLNGYDPTRGHRPHGPVSLKEQHLPKCWTQRHCHCAWMTDGAIQVDPDLTRMVRVTAINGVAQVRLECIRHGWVGDPLPQGGLAVDGQPVDVWALPERNAYGWSER